MKKTLLIAAAALAASVISSQAQVYSQNIVGYVNVVESAGGFNLEAPQLDLDGTGTNDTVSTVYPNPSVNDAVYSFNTNSGAYDIISFLVKSQGHGANQTFTTNWYDLNGNVASSYPINVGKGVFYNAAVNETNTFTGVVLSGTLTNGFFPAPGTFNLVASQVPIAGGLDSVLGYVPNVNDSVYIYTNGQYAIYSYLIKSQGHGANQTFTTNWYDLNANPGEPVINVGQGFWFNPLTQNTWVQTFNNQ